MRSMYRGTLIALALLLTACLPDLTGIEDLDAYGTRIADHGVVASVTCPSATLGVGQTMRCEAYNAQGTRLRADGITVVLWSTSDAAVAAASLDGEVAGVSAGTAEVRAEGTRGSTASATVTVQ
jgi:uncharacterized protein YjdB